MIPSHTQKQIIAKDMSARSEAREEIPSLVVHGYTCTADLFEKFPGLGVLAKVKPP